MDSVYDIEWAPGVKYADVRLADEQQLSVYNFEKANVDRLWRLLESMKPNARNSWPHSRTPTTRPVSRCSGHTNKLFKCSH